jgi:hypothetical protein
MNEVDGKFTSIQMICQNFRLVQYFFACSLVKQMIPLIQYNMLYGRFTSTVGHLPIPFVMG